MIATKHDCLMKEIRPKKYLLFEYCIECSNHNHNNQVVSTMPSAPLFLVFLSGLLGSASSFVPQAFVRQQAATKMPALQALTRTPFETGSFEKLDSLLFADDLSDMGVDPALVNSVSSGFLSTFKNVLLVGGGFVAVLLLITAIFATFIIPAAAKELEQQIERDYPELWREYQAKLGPGEVLSQRPDLIQELGTKLQKKQMEDFDRQAAEDVSSFDPTTSSSSSTGDSSSSSSTSSPSSSPNIIDVETSKDEKKE
jgi:hypothetical protein